MSMLSRGAACWDFFLLIFWCPGTVWTAAVSGAEGWFSGLRDFYFLSGAAGSRIILTFEKADFQNEAKHRRHAMKIATKAMYRQLARCRSDRASPIGQNRAGERRHHYWDSCSRLRDRNTYRPGKPDSRSTRFGSPGCCAGDRLVSARSS